jgi:hypothetical protein
MKAQFNNFDDNARIQTQELYTKKLTAIYSVLLRDSFTTYNIYPVENTEHSFVVVLCDKAKGAVFEPRFKGTKKECKAVAKALNRVKFKEKLADIDAKLS